MKCMKCNNEMENRRFRVCENCLSENTRRARRPRLTPKELARNTRWYYNRIPSVRGTVDCVHTGGYVHLQVDDNNGHFTWISTIEDFMSSWTRIKQNDYVALTIDDIRNWNP